MEAHRPQRRRAAAGLRVALAFAGTLAVAAAAANPFSAISETFSDWKDRLFGKPKPVAEAPAEDPVELALEQPVKLRIDKASPEREFPKGTSRYRVIELPQGIDHASLRVQVAALGREQGRGREVFKPFLYPLGDDGTLGTPVEIKPLHLDIRPFRRTRLLGCVALTLDKVRRFAVATSPEIVGKSYESEVREAVKAPTQGGFYYATDAVKVKLPWAATGELIIEATGESAAGKGC